MVEREKLAEAILNHAMEIICLLTVEDYIVVKRPPDGTRCTFGIRAAEIKSSTFGSTSGCSELLFTLNGMEDKTQKMIADLANKIVWLSSQEVPEKCEDVVVYFSEDESEDLEVHEEQYKDNRDTCIIERPTALVQQSTEKSYPIMNRSIKEERNEEPQHAIEQPTALVQQSKEKAYPMNLCIKEELKKEVHHVTDGTSSLSSAPFIPGRSERKLILPTVNIYIPVTESQDASGLIFISPCDLNPESGGGSSENTINSVAAEQPMAPVQQSTENRYPMKSIIKEEPNEGTYHARDGTSSIPSSGFIPESSKIKPHLPSLNVHVPFTEAQSPSVNVHVPFTEAQSSSVNVHVPFTEAQSSSVNVHVPFTEAQSASGFSFITSRDIKPEPDEGSSEDTVDSMDDESPQPPSSPEQEDDYHIIEYIHEDSEQSEENEDFDCMSPPLDTFIRADKDEDEDYVPPKPIRSKSRKARPETMPPPCEVCGKVLCSKSTLEKHLQIHTGDRPFQCDDCGKKFSCRNHLTTHERVHSGERPYTCNECGRKFFKQQHLVLHQVVHTGEKPYSCPVCGKGFTRQSSVVKHSGMHAEQKPHVCNVCGKSYCQYASLVVHQRLHSGEKPFVCRHCKKAFTCKATMLKHEKSH